MGTGNQTQILPSAASTLTSLWPWNSCFRELDPLSKTFISTGLSQHHSICKALLVDMAKMPCLSIKGSLLANLGQWVSGLLSLPWQTRRQWVSGLLSLPPVSPLTLDWLFNLHSTSSSRAKVSKLTKGSDHKLLGLYGSYGVLS